MEIYCPFCGNHCGTKSDAIPAGTVLQEVCWSCRKKFTLRVPGAAAPQAVPVQPPPHSPGAKFVAVFFGILGLLSGIVAFIPWFGWFTAPVTGLVSIVFGHISQAASRHCGGTCVGCAVTGRVLGTIGLVFGIALWAGVCWICRSAHA